MSKEPEFVQVRLLDNLEKVKEEMMLAGVGEEGISPASMLGSYVLDECGGTLVDALEPNKLTKIGPVKAVTFCDRVYEIAGDLYTDPDSGANYMDFNLFT